jgi:hypothetical protein
MIESLERRQERTLRLRDIALKPLRSRQAIKRVPDRKRDVKVRSIAGPDEVADPFELPTAPLDAKKLLIEEEPESPPVLVGRQSLEDLGAIDELDRPEPTGASQICSPAVYCLVPPLARGTLAPPTARRRRRLRQVERHVELHLDKVGSSLKAVWSDSFICGRASSMLSTNLHWRPRRSPFTVTRYQSTPRSGDPGLVDREPGGSGSRSWKQSSSNAFCCVPRQLRI